MIMEISPGMKHHFIVVDDDGINNVTCRRVIINTLADAYVQTFTDPEIALEYLGTMRPKLPDGEIILFLDINMPNLTGWDFLDAFERFDPDLKARFKIYMLSSSTDEKDKARAAKYKNVCGYIEKPFSTNLTLKLK
jgi:CheY-like chemotaxis protein